MIPFLNRSVTIRRLNQHIAAFVTSLGGFALGVTVGWNSSAGEVLRNILDANNAKIGLIGAILNVGLCVGVLIVPFLIRFVKRTTTVLITMSGLLIGWMFICFAGQKVTLYIVGRFICGISAGGFCVLTPIYIADIADENSRQQLVAYFHLLINCGIMYAFVIAHVLDEDSTVWRYSLICAITCPLIALMNLLPESPLCYLMKNNETDAKRSLKWYRGEAYEDEPELQKLKQLAIISRRKIRIRMLMNRHIVRSFFMCLFAFLSQQMSGVNVMIFHALVLFNLSGSGNMTGSEETLVIGALQILSCFLAMCLINILGRRILLVVSVTLMGLFSILLGCFFKLREEDPEYDDIYFWMPPTWTSLFFVAFNVGLGPISWCLVSDGFPLEIRTNAIACVVSLNWLLSLLAMLVFESALSNYGAQRTMWIFAACCWLGGALSVLFVKETHGRTLTEIQESFNGDIQGEIGELN
ncbi:hypothetical protein HN011_009427, partial [Eciton burchellii]